MIPDWASKGVLLHSRASLLTWCSRVVALAGAGDCLPCIESGCPSAALDGDAEFCNVCWTESLLAAPCVKVRIPVALCLCSGGVGTVLGSAYSQTAVGGFTAALSVQYFAFACLYITLLIGRYMGSSS